MTDRRTLTKLARRASRGDRAALERLCEISHPELYAYAMYLTRDRQQAQELTQETFIRIVEHIHELREPERFLAWAKKILYHLLPSGDAAGNQRSAVYLTDSFLAAIADEDERSIPDSAIDLAQQEQIVREILDSLQPQQRALLLAYYYEERPLSEIAASTALPEGTVKSRLYYSRQAFHRKLAAYERKHHVDLRKIGRLLGEDPLLAGRPARLAGLFRLASISKGSLLKAGLRSSSEMRPALGKVLAGVLMSLAVLGFTGASVYTQLPSHQPERTASIQQEQIALPEAADTFAAAPVAAEQNNAAAGARAAADRTPGGVPLPGTGAGNAGNRSGSGNAAGRHGQTPAAADPTPAPPAAQPAPAAEENPEEVFSPQSLSLYVRPTGHNASSLSWELPTGDAAASVSEYRIYRGLSDDEPNVSKLTNKRTLSAAELGADLQQFSLIAVMPPDCDSYQDTAAVRDFWNTYILESWHTDNTKEVLLSRSVQCGFNGAAPPMPTVVNMSTSSEDAVSILDNTTHIRETLGSDGLEIQRRAGTAEEFEPLVSLNYRLGKSNSYLDKDVRKGVIYQYRLRTWRILDGEKVFSPWSKAVRIRL